MLATLLPGHFPSALHCRTLFEGERREEEAWRSQGGSQQETGPACTFHHSQKFSCPPLCSCVRLWPLGYASPRKGVPCWDMSPETGLADDCFSRVSHSRPARGESTAARHPPPPLGSNLSAFPKGFLSSPLGWGPGNSSLSVSSSVKLAVGVGRLRFHSGQERGDHGSSQATPTEMKHQLGKPAPWTAPLPMS